jgi:hypothetical protein
MDFFITFLCAVSKGNTGNAKILWCYGHTLLVAVIRWESWLDKSVQ